MIISAEDALRYEVRSSRWTRFIESPVLQKLASRYFAWKVNRKYPRYRKSLQYSEMQEFFSRL